MLPRSAYGLLARAVGLISRSTSEPLRSILLALRSEIVMQGVHSAGLVASQGYRHQRGLRLHLGCGDIRKPGWINIDGRSGDLTLDLRRPLPFPTGSCATIYSEHFLEHIDYPDAAFRLLAECYRVLEPGGTIDIGVPDTEWPLLEYAGLRDEGYFAKARSSWHPKWCQTRLEHINYHFRQDGRHRFAYDYETLERALLTAGFVDVQRRSFDQQTDSLHRQPGTLYVISRRHASVQSSVAADGVGQ
jgi:predicted SAM-dependent methyltransferase